MEVIESILLLLEPKDANLSWDLRLFSCGSNVNCKLQTWPQDRGHVTFCGLQFAVSHQKRDAKGLYDYLDIRTLTHELIVITWYCFQKSEARDQDLTRDTFILKCWEPQRLIFNIFSDQRHCQQYTCTANQLLYKLWSLNSAKNQYSFTDSCVAVDRIVSRQTTLINEWYVTLLQRHSTWNERASTWLYSKQLVAWLCFSMDRTPEIIKDEQTNLEVFSNCLERHKTFLSDSKGYLYFAWRRNVRIE